LPNVGPYIYDVSISGFTRSSIYIYDISSLRVNITWRYSSPECLTYSTSFFRYYECLPIFLGCTDLPKNSSWFPDWCVSGSCIV